MASNKVARLYGDFRGIDLRSEECSLQRSPDCLNMWKDYRKAGGISTRPILEVWTNTTGEKVHSITWFKGHLTVHVGNKLVQYSTKDAGYAKVIATAIEDSDSQTFVFDEKLYIKTATDFVYTDGNFLFSVISEAYVPTTTTGRSPAGDGDLFEGVNMLSRQRINEFIADGESKEYYLDAKNTVGSARVWIDEVEKTSGFSTDTENGVVKFTDAPEKGAKVKIRFLFRNPLVLSEDEKKIYNCKLVQVFDNRVFFSGNPDYPNMIWHSAVDNPTYVSDRNHYTDGKDEAAIRAMVAGNDTLWVFREPSEENTTVFYHRPVMDADYGKVYPAVHSSISTGCTGRAINFNDDIVFFSRQGMEGVNADITTEQALSHRSSVVDSEMTGLDKYKEMALLEWEGYLLVFIGNMVYLADSRGKFSNETHWEYEWFRWRMDEFAVNNKITCAIAINGEIYAGDELGNIWTTSFRWPRLNSYWTTTKDKFKNPNRLKTTNKRGCVVEATGDVAVYAKTEDTEFELIADEKGVTDYFVPRIKQKKFKDIQLKFQSDTGFTLDSATMECYIGGYIKR